MLVADNYHLTYCTNIHPGENWQVTFDNLKRYVPLVKKQVSDNRRFGLGLRLSNTASKELGFGHNLEEFKQWLEINEVYVFTMNGFPYGNFHGESVKENVHSPDWTTTERLEYTKRLFQQLAYLLPDGINGGISTSPISYKHWFKNEKALEEAKQIGAEQMLTVAIQLYEIERRTGKYLHLDIEPEPDGVLENSHEVILYYKDYLVPIGLEKLSLELGLGLEEAERLIKRYLTVCYDICHFSLAYEPPEDTFSRFLTNDIIVGKIQVSAALKILFGDIENETIWNYLKRFNEPTYLHQVTALVEDGVKTYSDLPEVINSKIQTDELRAHFHVPIFLEQFLPLYSTQDQILNVLVYLKKNRVCEHLEVETYTWDVLPSELKLDISQSIVRELNWLKERL
ncbi:metabolite traffic protein EboE [uncultured Croceitalea sp.]|uniref:metabolite traffic protein EboE n=1 Tax=uncultured Croceitalea sp. TaxID=1798908 RepID=UPI0033062A86